MPFTRVLAEVINAHLYYCVIYLSKIPVLTIVLGLEAILTVGRPQYRCLSMANANNISMEALIPPSIPAHLINPCEQPQMNVTSRSILAILDWDQFSIRN